MAETKLFPMTRKRDQHQHQNDRKTALSPPMKIGQFELVDPVYQVAIIQIAIDVPVQPPAKRIDERRHHRRHPSDSHSTSPMPGANRGQRILLANALDKRSESVDSQQRYTKEPSAMQIHPKQHRGGKEPRYPSRQASMLISFLASPTLPPFQRDKPEQRKKPANNVRARVQMNRRSGHR